MVDSRPMQRKLALVFIGAFVLLLILLVLSAPSPKHFTERVLVGLVQPSNNLLDDDFGSFPDLVKDMGGAQPVPYSPDWLPHPQFRDANWLLSQSPELFTLQIGVFASEDSVKNVLAERVDSDRFVYVHVRDPAYREEPLVPMIVDGEVVPAVRPPPPRRFILTFGEFASIAEAEATARAMMGLPGRPVVRAWAALQMLHVPGPLPSVQEAAPVEVLRPGEEPVQIESPEVQELMDAPDIEARERAVPVLSLPFR